MIYLYQYEMFSIVSFYQYRAVILYACRADKLEMTLLLTNILAIAIWFSVVVSEIIRYYFNGGK